MQFLFLLLIIYIRRKKLYTNTQTARTEGSGCMNSECQHRKCCVHSELSYARAYSAYCRWKSSGIRLCAVKQVRPDVSNYRSSIFFGVKQPKADQQDSQTVLGCIHVQRK